MNLVSKNIIDKNENFVDSNAYTRLKTEYPNAFPGGVKPNKIKKANNGQQRTKIRAGKFDELKALWERINQKAILEYKIADEKAFLELFKKSLHPGIWWLYLFTRYSPDFAYIVKTSKGDYLNFIIETKNVDGKDELRKEEERKIEHAKRLFSQISKDVNVEFKTQFADDVIYELIRQSIQA